jgi:hypothetical protein
MNTPLEFSELLCVQILSLQVWTSIKKIRHDSNDCVIYALIYCGWFPVKSIVQKYMHWADQRSLNKTKQANLISKSFGTLIRFMLDNKHKSNSHDEPVTCPFQLSFFQILEYNLSTFELTDDTSPKWINIFMQFVWTKFLNLWLHLQVYPETYWRFQFF